VVEMLGSERGRLCVLRGANCLPVEPEHPIRSALCAAGPDINKPIKASRGVEVSWPEFPSGALLPAMLLLLSGHQYASTDCSRNTYPLLRQLAQNNALLRRQPLEILISLMAKSQKGCTRRFVRHKNSKWKDKKAFPVIYVSLSGD
jgi:hypothetical protein